MLRRQLCCVRSLRRRAIVTFLLISCELQLWSWKWLCCQKAHEWSFPTIHLPNGNAIKLSHTNQKHFTVSDPMAFPIVKMGNKTPKNLPFPLHDVDPHLMQQCLGPPHAPPETGAPTVEALLHAYAVKSPLVRLVHPKFAPKVPQYLPHPWTRLTYDAKRHSDPIRRFHNALDRPTHRQTDRLSMGKFDDYRLLRL